MHQQQAQPHEKHAHPGKRACTLSSTCHSRSRITPSSTKTCFPSITTKGTTEGCYSIFNNNKGNISSAKGHQPAMKTVAYSNVSGLAVMTIMTMLRRIKITFD
jgi:hypothetical protein